MGDADSPVSPSTMRIRQMSMSDDTFKSHTQGKTLTTLAAELERLLVTAPDGEQEKWAREFKGYHSLFTRFLNSGAPIDWAKIRPMPDRTSRNYLNLAPPAPSKIPDLLSKLVVVKLNGGLGTSMGCQGPKSLISVRNDLTFLDFVVQQVIELNRVHSVDVPLVLMNSFNTDEDSRKILPKYNGLLTVEAFNQSRYPRINKETYAPVAASLASPDLEPWYPPGHGDFYAAFDNSGLLDKYIEEGKEYVFLSNIDNLGATVDLQILNHVLSDPAQPEFVMEVTDKTRADVKGGTLIEYENKLRLLEIAQVPKDHVDEFKSVNKFRIFNTNNLWVNLKALRRQLDNKAIEGEVIVNPKVAHPKHMQSSHLESGVAVIQLETAAGAAIQSFNNACAVNVPRGRFLPVKKTQDLLLLMSNLYDIQSGKLTLSTRRMFPTTPIIKLGSEFDKVQNFLSRFSGVPDLLELDHLTVSGNVWFGKNVTLKGTVIIIANHGERIDIAQGTYLENKIVSGNLRILDH